MKFEGLLIQWKIIGVLILIIVDTLNAQTSVQGIDLDQGEYRVGFRHYTVLDSTRTYRRAYEYSNSTMPRPVPVSIWYPSIETTENVPVLKVLDYFEILKEEEEWEYLPDEYLLDWFYYANTPSNQEHLQESTHAYPNTPIADGRFPVIVYTPSFQASSIENFALCEYLASHGYIVIASPSRGTTTRWFSNNLAQEMETQARDVALLISEIGKYPMADYARIAVAGFSFGGLSNMIAQNQHAKIKAVLSLDGTERYQYALLRESPYFDPEKIRVSYFHMAQKEIPEEVLLEDAISPDLNTDFQLYDRIANSTVYRLRFHDLTHSYFSTLGVLFAERDPRQDKSDAEIMASYKWAMRYSLNFFDAILKKEEAALRFIENKPEDNGVGSGLLSHQIKRPERVSFTFQDFNDLAAAQNYQDLPELYDSIQKKHADFKIPEGNLNTLGLQLVFNPETSQKGIAVFHFATERYPNSANLFDSLGEGYLFLGDKENAINAYEKSLELNAANQNAIDRLKELRE
ncbi:prolyl oligopeptidase family serine peptidase [Robertkochia solimangrovi]|uniref:poly(ethylene terephthalate) hydrolase family protein n=1 Tax=Robertkochia solimangrovi TaxID=2213046 RepID=UPI00117F095A|nr:prolyl oligopeptidase family serine peptidase [Robertkochia solimangrovi]TRZ45108.1 alpha/beta hydrolase [Robertkochia solimangrovi]